MPTRDFRQDREKWVKHATQSVHLNYGQFNRRAVPHISETPPAEVDTLLEAVMDQLTRDVQVCGYERPQAISVRRF